jgi:hypothetical protein
VSSVFLQLFSLCALTILCVCVDYIWVLTQTVTARHLMGLCVMFTVMSERIRLVILTSEELRDALRLEAARRGGIEMSELATEILSEALVDALTEVRARPASKKKGGGK